MIQRRGYFGRAGIGHASTLLIVPRGNETLVVSAESVETLELDDRATSGASVPQSPCELGALLARERGRWLARAPHVVLVLPRPLYLWKRFELPPFDPDHAPSVIQHQIDVKTNLGDEDPLFDFEALSKDQVPGGTQPEGGQCYAVAIAPRSVVRPWKAVVEAAGLKLAAVVTRSQIHGQWFGRRDAFTLVVVQDDCGVELQLTRQGQVWSSVLVERLPGETMDEEDLVAALQGMRRSMEEEWGAIRFIQCSGLELPSMPRMLQQELPWAQMLPVAGPADSLASILREISRCPQQAGCLNLARTNRSASSGLSRRRNRLRGALVAALVLACGAWASERRLSDLDRQLATLEAELEAGRVQLDRGEPVARVHDAITQRVRTGGDWTEDLDAVLRSFEVEDSVRLVSLQADAPSPSRDREVMLSGMATDGAVLPRILARLAKDASIEKIEPLGIQPLREGEGNGMKFDLRVVRKATKASGSTQR